MNMNVSTLRSVTANLASDTEVLICLDEDHDGIHLFACHSVVEHHGKPFLVLYPKAELKKV